MTDIISNDDFSYSQNDKISSKMSKYSKKNTRYRDIGQMLADNFYFSCLHKKR